MAISDVQKITVPLKSNRKLPRYLAWPSSG